ncbi:MAG TPA: DinB family protein [Dehalococcoidia bacterium]|nr:DinB family protein [Dehalococcoidia bacterium]
MYADDSHAWLLKALRETAGALQSYVWGLDDEALRRRPAPDEWCLLELLGHLRDCERRYLERLEAMAFEREPKIAAFDAESIQPDVPYVLLDPDETLAEFESLRHRTLRLLRSLSDEDWERTGLHPYLGPVTVTQVVREMSEHDLSHVWQARRIVEAVTGVPAD